MTPFGTSIVLLSRRAAHACLGLLLLPAFVDMARAEDPYLFDVMKEAAYRNAVIALLQGERRLPAWLAQITGKENYVASPEKQVRIDGVTYRLFHACKAHDCGGNEFEVMFAPGASRAFGALIDQGGPPRFFGKPSPAQAQQLEAALKE